jgi:hypothetical protein
MALWGNTDTASNSCIFAAAQFNKTPNTGNQTALFGNTNYDAFVTGMMVSQYGVDSTEIGVSNGAIVSYTVTSPGSGYSANAVVTVSIAGVANVTVANSTVNNSGKVSALTINVATTDLTTSPEVTIAAPAAKVFSANTLGVNATADAILITTANSIFRVGDYVTYSVAAGNTALSPLASGSQYYIVAANTTAVKISSTKGGTAVNLEIVVANEAGHSLTGETATATAVISGLKNKVPHTGWVIRTEGTGGRAGRVQYEVLATLNGPTTDASDDTYIKDA